MLRPEWDDTDYVGASSYAARRRADPLVARQLHAALGSAQTVINVGAGTGNYEPRDRYVLAVEPSADMRARRPAGLPPALDARADSLPFDEDAFDAALAVLTVHHWPDPSAGLRELRRVTKGPVVILTADPDALDHFWLATYAPEFHAAESRRYPPLSLLASALQGAVSFTPLRIPLACSDGFSEAFYGRPEAFLEDDVRRAQSAWSFVSADAERRFVERLTEDLDSGAWDRSYGHLRTQPEFEGSMQILTASPK
jgi:SAM-dependent methyltransferase